MLGRISERTPMGVGREFEDKRLPRQGYQAPVDAYLSKILAQGVLESSGSFEKFTEPIRTYPGEITQVTIGATKGDGGTRGKRIVIGGEKVPPFYLFEGMMPHRPVISIDVFDVPPSLASAMKAPYKDVLDDPSEWARKAVEEYGADMINLHLTSTDPLIRGTSPEDAAKTMENVLQAVDVPLSIGGCGDPEIDLQLFKRLAEVGEGERLLFNSITLDMNVKEAAEAIGGHGHAVIAFTSMDLSLARELNRKLREAAFPTDSIIMDTTTAALGYGIEYAFSVMERARLSGLMGDPELRYPIASGTTNAWAAREAWMKMEPRWGPRELRGPIWETVTAITLLLAGVDYFMMMHPTAVKTLKNMINELLNGRKASAETIINWVNKTI